MSPHLRRHLVPIGILSLLVASLAHAGTLQDSIQARRLARTGEAASSSTRVPVATRVAVATEEDVFMGEEQQRISAVAKANEAVVSIVISKNLPVLKRSFEEIEIGNGFRMRVPRVVQNGTTSQVVGAGSAFFISADGYLLTSNHVVSDSDAEYTVLLNTGEQAKARVVAQDAAHDLALLRVDRDAPAFLPLARPGDIHLAQTAIAIGNSLGEYHNTVSVGVISALRRDIQASGGGGNVETLTALLQTDASINAGNSGGPLLSIRGDVIGLNTAVASDAENVGFAISADTLREFLRTHLPS